MREAAVVALSESLGSIIYGDGFAVIVEPHRDDKRGEHKGASVLLPTGASR